MARMIPLILSVCELAAALLVPGLGSPPFRRRESAHRALAAAGRLALPALVRAAADPDPEIRRRARILLGPYAEEIADRRAHAFRPTAWPRRPWISLHDCSASGYLSKARESVKATGAPDWPEYREATRLWVRSALLQRRPVEEIQSELDRMADEERRWVLQNGANYKPPIRLPLK